MHMFLGSVRSLEKEREGENPRAICLREYNSTLATSSKSRAVYFYPRVASRTPSASLLHLLFCTKTQARCDGLCPGGHTPPFTLATLLGPRRKQTEREREKSPFLKTNSTGAEYRIRESILLFIEKRLKWSNRF